jgi:SAM-dependent methyltransferase
VPGGFVHRPVCEVCGSARAQVLFSTLLTDPAVWGFLTEHYGGRVCADEVAGALYEVLACEACGFVWQAYVPDEALTARLYDEWISAEESRARRSETDEALRKAFSWQIAGIAPLVGKRPGETNVLDFGAGWGTWCAMAQVAGYNVKGVEISQRRIEHARARGVQMVSSLDELGAWRADYVNVEQVLEHVRQPAATMAGLASVLAADGVVRVSVPNSSGVRRALAAPGYAAGKDAVQPLEHINCYTPAVLRRLGRQAGLRPLRRAGLLLDGRRWRAGVRAAVGTAYRAWLRVRGRRPSHVVYFTTR